MTCLYHDGSGKRLHAVLAEGKSFVREPGKRKHKDGSLVDVSVSIAPMRDDSGRVIGAVGSMHHLTDALT